MRFRHFLFVFAALCLLPLSAARADSDPFTVSGIKVDATGASSTEAQNFAINGGRQKAWTMLVHRLTRSQDWPRVPALDDNAVQKLIRTYQIANERRSTTRYVADVTYVFNPDAVRRFFRGANIAYTDMQAHPILVIPMGQAYAPRSPWGQAWKNPRYATGAVPLVVPNGDAVDSTSLSAVQFASAAWSDIEPIASRAHATQAAVAQAIPAPDHITVRMRLLAPGGQASIPDVTVPTAKMPPAKAFAAAADAAADAITNAWKSRSAVDFNQRLKLTVEVRIPSPDVWGATLQKMGTIPTILDVNVSAMNMSEARIVITYAGTQEQLHDFLSQAGLDLSQSGGTWWLAPGGVPQ